MTMTESEVSHALGILRERRTKGFDDNPGGTFTIRSPETAQPISEVVLTRTAVDREIERLEAYERLVRAAGRPGNHDRAGAAPAPRPAAGTRTDDPWTRARDNDGVNRLSRTDARSLALSAVERASAMPDPARQTFTATLEGDQDPEARLARYTLTLSDPHYRAAFARWFNDPVSGHYAWSPEERDAWRRVEDISRAMGLSPATSGGHLVPFELDPQILIAGAGSVDPMRRVCRVSQTAFNEKRFVTSLGVTATWTPEAQQQTDDSPALLQPALTAFKGAAFVPVSYELFEDSDIAQQIQGVLLDAKVQLESPAFTTGTGVAQPKGIITALVAAGGATIIATGSNVLAQADLYNNQAALPARWRPNARWMMNLSIINGYRQLPQATGLNYSIVNDDGPAPKALGWEIAENSAMDGTLTGAAADYLVLSGDFQQMAVIDRVGAAIEFVPHLFGAAGRPTGQRGFYLHWRTGSDVLIPDAFRLSNFST